MALARARRGESGMNYWPGFVDALSTLILSIIFILTVFVVVQFYLQQEVAGKDTALTRLNKQVAELTELLSMEKTGKAKAEDELDQLRASLALLQGDRDKYKTLATSAASDRDKYQDLIAAAESERDKYKALAAAAEADRDKYKNLADSAAAASSQAADQSTALSSQIEEQKRIFAEAIAQAEKQKRAAADALTAAASQKQAAAAAEAEVVRQRQIASGALAETEKQKRISAEALAQVEVLNQQIAALRRQLTAIQTALDMSEKQNKTSQVRIADLGRRLNLAMAQKVQELNKENKELTAYRSDFFGKLRQILGNRPDVRVVGDRFVLQSEVFFDTNKADLKPEASAELDKVAGALAQMETQIPPDIPWVLRVDGHTDTRPITGGQFKSNWDLSVARAVAVVKYLISKGVAPQRLMAAGFGEYQPIDTGTTEDAYRRNRRIEFKLTER
jgi:chemotaxis protein MotB